MGSIPILPDKVPVSIGTLLKLNGPNFGNFLVVGTCEQSLTRKILFGYNS